MRTLLLPSLCLLLSMGACSDTSSPSTGKLPAPTLLTPRPDIPIRQNDPTTGCAFSPSHGYGFQIHFSWTAILGATQYHIVSWYPDASIPILDTVVDQPDYVFVSCNAYVVQPLDWRWTVAGISTSGAEGNVSAEGTYTFGPMVLPPSP